MRLTEHECAVIREAARRRFGADARVFLFGSRTDDSARGGDIDLYIELDRPLDGRVTTAAAFEADLIWALGDQHVDVVVRDPETPDQPIHQVARRRGIALT